AMKMQGMPISGQRPDLLAFKNNELFAIEAKGYSSNSPKDMNSHKEQSRTGGIPVDFTVASISYNLYDRVICNY
ncbi:hypothetical protein J7M00_05465, partial [bacterium]|nr:hypothetical protein [bacterium]